MSDTTRETIKKLKKADDLYYNGGKSELTDAEYDSLKDSLRELAFGLTSGSPAAYEAQKYLKSVGAPVSRDTPWEKASHKISMCSLNKCNTEEEFIKWCKGTRADLFVIQEKLDGLSINLEYEDGVLKRSISRGDGVVGEDIFENVKRMKNVREGLGDFNGSIRGEIILTNSDFEKLCVVQEFANPRNAASGICKRHDHKFSEYLTILYYDVQSDEFDFETEREKIDFLCDGNELTTVTSHVVSMKDAIRIFHEYVESRRASINWDVDGLVIKVDNCYMQKDLGELGGNPAGQIAWKFPPIVKETRLLNVDWQLGRSGKITPVAILEPVQMGGVTVKRASLYNVDNFLNFSFNKNDVVLVSRQNDVIPAVLEIAKKSKEEKFEYIKKCPSCGNSTKIEGKFLICDNEECSGSSLGSIMKWIDKAGIKKLGVGEKTIEALFEADLIETPADLYRLKKEDIRTLNRQGERSSEKIFEAIQSRSELSLADFLGALNIKDFSTSMFEKLIEAGYNSLDKLQKIAEVPDPKYHCLPFELANINGIGEKKAEAFIVGMNKKKELIRDLLTVVKIKNLRKEEISSGKLSGKSFCFTGSINRIDESTGKNFKREQMWDLVRKNGGEVAESVKSGLTHLVMADINSTSGKTQKAKKLGITLLSESDFFKMIGM